MLSPASLTGSPWQMMRRMQEEMDRLFRPFFGAGEEDGLLSPAGSQWGPSMDISESENEWCIEADLPGVNKDDVHVEVRNQHLIIKAETRQPAEAEEKGEGRRYYRRERRYGYFERVLPLPENVDEEQISCDFTNGVLAVHVPKSESARQPARRIPVGDGKGRLESGKQQGGKQGTEGKK